MAVSSENVWIWQWSEVYRLNRKGKRTRPCGIPMRQTTTSVDGPHSQLLVPSGSLQPPSQRCRLDGVENTGEVQKHDPHSAPSLLQARKGSVQPMDDGVLHSDTRPVGEQQGVERWAHQRTKVVQDEPLQGLYQVSSQGCRSVMVGLLGPCDSWHRNHPGGLPQFRNPLQTQAQVEDMPEHLTAGLHSP